MFTASFHSLPVSQQKIKWSLRGSLQGMEQLAAGGGGTELGSGRGAPQLSLLTLYSAALLMPSDKCML